MPAPDTLFAYMAPQPSLPVASIAAIAVGVALIFGRGVIQAGSRWLRPASSRRFRSDSDAAN